MWEILNSSLNNSHLGPALTSHFYLPIIAHQISSLKKKILKFVVLTFSKYYIWSLIIMKVIDRYLLWLCFYMALLSLIMIIISRHLLWLCVNRTIYFILLYVCVCARALTSHFYLPIIAHQISSLKKKNCKIICGFNIFQILYMKFDNYESY